MQVFTHSYWHGIEDCEGKSEKLMDWDKQNIKVKPKLHAQARQNEEFIHHLPWAGRHSCHLQQSQASKMAHLRQLYIHGFPLCSLWQNISKFWNQSLPQLLSILVFCLSLSLKFLHPPLVADVAGYPQENSDSCLLGLSSGRNLNDYLVELFVERFSAVHKLIQEQLWIAWDILWKRFSVFTVFHCMWI